MWTTKFNAGARGWWARNNRCYSNDWRHFGDEVNGSDNVEAPIRAVDKQKERKKKSKAEGRDELEDGMQRFLGEISYELCAMRTIRRVADGCFLFAGRAGVVYTYHRDHVEHFPTPLITKKKNATRPSWRIVDYIFTNPVYACTSEET